MWRVSESVSFDKGRRVWVWEDQRLVGAVNAGDLRTYVFPFYTPLRRLVIQESPVDHPHHQGLTVGARLNGWDLWNAGSFSSPRSPQVLLADGSRCEADGNGARFLMVHDWTAESGEKLAREERRITFSSAPYGNIVDVRARFVAAYGEIRFEQTKEAGLSMRVPPEWETPNGGVILASAGRTGESNIFDREADWVDVSGEGPKGILAGITLMPHKDSPRVPWMVRDYGLHNYNPWRHSRIHVAESESFELGARYVAHDGRASVDEIAAWYKGCP